MQIQDYISSGILEAYIAGTLSDAEMAAVEAMAAQHPEVQAELDAISRVMEAYAHLHAKQPGPRVLKGILKSVEPPVSDSVEQETGRPVVRELRFRRLALAASILLFISLAGNIYYYNTAQRVSGELAEIQAENLRIASEKDVFKAGYDQLAAEMAILQDPANVTITMKGVPDHPSATAVLCWNRTSGQVYLVSHNLPEPAPGKQYQLWALLDGKPLDAGVFSTEKGLQTLKSFPEAHAFAVTLEPAGGSTVPSLDQLFVMAGV